jgi:hypothetical protein
MRKLNWIAGLSGIVLVALWVGFAYAQVSPPHIGANGLAEWQHNGQDVQGNPETLTFFELAVTPPIGVDLNGGDPALRSKKVTVSEAQVDSLNFETDLAELLSGMTEGSYMLWCRAEDAAGNMSTWTSTTFSLDSVDPTPPAAVKVIKVTVTVEIQQ